MCVNVSEERSLIKEIEVCTMVYYGVLWCTSELLNLFKLLKP